VKVCSIQNFFFSQLDPEERERAGGQEKHSMKIKGYAQKHSMKIKGYAQKIPTGWRS